VPVRIGELQIGEPPGNRFVDRQSAINTGNRESPIDTAIAYRQSATGNAKQASRLAVVEEVRVDVLVDRRLVGGTDFLELQPHAEAPIRPGDAGFGFDL
jgi:hypothetical protein